MTPARTLRSVHIQVSDNEVINSFIAKFSPDDPFSEQRMKCKERFNLLITKKPPIKL